MDFHKFVAWQNVPPLVFPKDEAGSSSSSHTGSGSEGETETETDAKPKYAAPKPEIIVSPAFDVPPSVKNVLEKLEVSQLERAKKEVSKKLSRIVDNVNRTYEYYKKDDGTDPDMEKEYQQSQSWEERSRRSHFLNKVTNVLEACQLKIQDLQMVLESFKTWRDMLKTVELKEREVPTYIMVDEMERHLLKSINSIEVNVQHLIKIFHPLFDAKNKPRRKSAVRPGLFKVWREKAIEKLIESEPLTPEQMLEDETHTIARIHEVNNMMQEMIDSTIFNKTEAVGIKYIAAMMASLTKAFTLLHKQCRSLKIKCDNLAILETRRQDPQIGNLQRELRAAREKGAALEMQVQNVEERCKVLTITNEMLQQELQGANERAMVASKVTFARAAPAKPLPKSPSDTERAVGKSQPDAEKEAKSKIGVKSQPGAEKLDGKPFSKVLSDLPEKMQSVSFEEKEIPVKILEAESRRPEKLHVVITEAEQREILPLLETFLPPVEISFTPVEASLTPLETRPQDSRISLDRTAIETGVLQILPEAEAAQALPEAEAAQALPEAPIAEASPDKLLFSEELPQDSEEKALTFTTSTEDEQPLEKEAYSKEKEHVPTGKLKAVQGTRQTAKLGQWKKLQSSILKKPTKSQERLKTSAPAPAPLALPEESTAAPIHDTVSVREPSSKPLEAGGASAPVPAPAPLAPSEESTAAPIHDTVSVREPSSKPLEAGGAHEPDAEEESIKGSSLEVERPVLSEQSEGDASPEPLEDDGFPKPEIEEESMKGGSPEAEPSVSSKQSEGEVSPKLLEDEHAPIPETEDESIKRSSSELEPPELPKLPAEAPARIPSPEGTRGKRRISLRTSAGKVVTSVKAKKLAKGMGESMAQKPAVARDIPEKGGIDSPQRTSLEEVEDSTVDTQEAGQIQAPKRLLGKTKEVREKRDVKRTGRMPTDVPQSKQEEKTEEIINGLRIKLQEAAREGGGVIDAETITEIFAEVCVTDRDVSPGEGSGSHPPEKHTKSSATKKSSLPFSGAEPTPRKERRSISVEESFSGQDAYSVLQDFQTAILASLDDMLEKVKKGSLGSQKRFARFQPTDAFAQNLLQVIEKKLEECFLANQKSLSGQGRPKQVRSIYSKGELLEEEEKEIKVITPSFDSHSVLAPISPDSSFSTLQTEGEKPIPPKDSSHVKTWHKQEEEEEEEGEQLWKSEEEPQSQKEFSFPLLPKVEEEEEHNLEEISSPKEEDHLSKESDVKHKESWQEGMKQPSEELQKHAWKEKEPQQKETKSEMGRKDSKKLDEYKEDWYNQLQEMLQEEKACLQEEQERLKEERQRLEEEAKYLEHWQEMFDQQLKQWEEQEEQRQEQENLWQVQLQHWQHMQQESNEQEEHWLKQQEQQKEQQILMQEEVERLKQEYVEYLKLRGKQAEEAWQWNQLKTWHEQQQQAWQEEDEEQERKRVQWQEQLASHKEQIEVLQQEREMKEQEIKKWQQEQKEKQEKLEHLWEQRWEQQLQSWHHQMHKQRTRQLKWQLQSYRLTARQQEIQRLKSPRPKVKVVEGSILDQFPKQHRDSPILRERLLSTTPQITPIPSKEFEEDSWELETTWFPKLFSKAEKFPVPVVTEKRYWINVEAQRKNLEVLKQAAQKAGISTDLYIKTKAVIHQVLHSNVERLALLFRKYESFNSLQEIRRNLTIKLDAARDVQDGATMQNIYKMVEKVDAYQKKVLERWTVKQNAVERKRRRVLEKMIALFAQLRSSTKLRLSDPCPLMVKGGDVTRRETLHLPRLGSVGLKTRVYRSPLISVKKTQDFTFSAVVAREPSSEQIESLWKTDITELGIPIGPKEPVSLLWSETCGFPDVPRLLELDISSIRTKPLQNVKTRIQNIPRWKLSGYDFMHL